MHNLDDLVAELQRLQPIPTTLRVTIDGEAEPRRIAVPNVRKRWSRIAATLAALPPWTLVEACAKDGSVIHAMRPDADAVPTVDGASAGGVTVREAELVRLVLEAQRQRDEAHRAMFGTLFRGVEQSLSIVALTMRQMAVSTEHRLTAVERTYQLQAPPPRRDDDDDEAPGGLEAIAPLIQAMAHGPAPLRKNDENVRRPTDPSARRRDNRQAPPRRRKA